MRLVSKYDLVREFAAAVNSMSVATDEFLINKLGIPNDVLYGGPSHVGVSRIEPDADGLYQPNPDGEEAVLVPSGIRRSEGIGWNEISNLVAFNPSDPGRYWRRIGGEVFLNPEAVRRAEHFNEPLCVTSTPLAWLQGFGEGCVILDWCAHIPLHLGGVGVIACDSKTIAGQIKAAFEGQQRCPEIRLFREAVHAA